MEPPASEFGAGSSYEDGMVQLLSSGVMLVIRCLDYSQLLRVYDK